MRARGSRIGAWASEQSQPLDSRETLLKKVSALEAQYEGTDIPRPPFWGGFRIVPTRIEFWQQGEFRLHDRFVFTRNASNGWDVQRLHP
jgi:pyridoxamine 5'-phosphate oxidase